VTGAVAPAAGSRSARAALVLLLLAPLVLAAGAPPAAAHAIVLESSPAHEATLAESPGRIVLRFNSRIEAGLSRVTIESPSGRPVALPAARDALGAESRLVVPVGPLPPGTYIVRYRVLAADGHVTEGALRFTVKATP
jgi:methionine-rich copper-binding protein CopC